MSNELTETLLDIARSHASALKAELSEKGVGSQSRLGIAKPEQKGMPTPELTRLKAEIILLEEKLRRARAEILDLRSALRKL